MRVTWKLLDVVVLGAKPIGECVTIAVGFDDDLDADKSTSRGHPISCRTVLLNSRRVCPANAARYMIPAFPAWKGVTSGFLFIELISLISRRTHKRNVAGKKTGRDFRVGNIQNVCRFKCVASNEGRNGR
jgi:hypothetical protein